MFDTQLSQQMRIRDREMVPRALVVAMFSLMAAAIALVTWQQMSGRENVGVLFEAPVVQSRSVTIETDGRGQYTFHDGGQQIGSSADHLGGFYGVIGRVVERRRIVHEIEGNPPVDVVRRENGNVAIIDDTSNFTIELIGYGKDNVAAFARLLD